MRVVSLDYPRFDPVRARKARELSPDLPVWYARRWHFLGDGYATAASVARYDRLVRLLYTWGVEGRLHRAVVDELSALGYTSILEIGPGPGRLLDLLAGDVRAIELSQPFAQRASRRIGEGVVRGDATDGSLFEPGSFDAIVTTHVLGHVPRAIRAGLFRSADLWLRPGGHLLALEHAWHDIVAGRSSFEQLPSRRVAAFQRLHIWRRAAGGQSQARMPDLANNSEGPMTQQSEEFARIRAYLQSQAAEKTIDELVERVQEGVAELEAAVRSIPAGHLDTVPPNEQPDGWSFRQCLEHSLGGNMATALDVLYTAHTGELPTTDPDPVGDSIDAMLATHANAMESVIAHVKDADPGAFLDIRWEHPMFGPLNWREWFLFLRIHSKDHARQIVGMVESVGS